MVLIFTRLRTKGTGQISSVFTFGRFCYGYPLRFSAAITYCFWNNKVYSTSNKLAF